MIHVIFFHMLEGIVGNIILTMLSTDDLELVYQRNFSVKKYFFWNNTHKMYVGVHGY